VGGGGWGRGRWEPIQWGKDRSREIEERDVVKGS
jgi:hypothetical protein